MIDKHLCNYRYIMHKKPPKSNVTYLNNTNYKISLRLVTSLSVNLFIVTVAIKLQFKLSNTLKVTHIVIIINQRVLLTSC